MTAAPAVAAATSEGDSRALVIRKLRKEYRPGVPVLKDIDLAIPRRGMTAVIGPAGTSAPTLFRGQDLAKLSGLALRQARRRIGMVFQEYNLVERLSVMENLQCGRLGYVSPFKAWLRRYPQRDIERAFDLLETVGLSAHAHARADSLSGGQRQRVGIARAMMQEPRLLLADEPTSSLDPKTSAEIMALVQTLSGRHSFPVIINIHNVELARRFADRVVGMTGGRVVFDGAPDAITDEHLKTIYGGEDWLD